MNPSLTVLLPVHNAQATLSATVTEVLDVAADLDESFELLIVDDGSIDATGEVVDELSRRYPQIRVVRHGERLGYEAALRSGMKHSAGRTVLLRDDIESLSPADHHMSGAGRPRSKMPASRPARPNYARRARDLAPGG